MTEEQLQKILEQVWYRDISADEAVNLIFGKPFEGWTEIKTQK